MAISEQVDRKIKSGSISKVIEALGSKLKRVGREYVTQCIWHEDTNPSLTINDDKGFCFCHVCRGGGDVIAYTRKRKGLDFVDAANLSAEILGIQVQTDGVSPEEQAKRKAQRMEALGLATERARTFTGPTCAMKRQAASVTSWPLVAWTEDQQGVRLGLCGYRLLRRPDHGAHLQPPQRAGRMDWACHQE